MTGNVRQYRAYEGMYYRSTSSRCIATSKIQPRSAHQVSAALSALKQCTSNCLWYKVRTPVVKFVLVLHVIAFIVPALTAKLCLYISFSLFFFLFQIDLVSYLYQPFLVGCRASNSTLWW